MTVIKYLGCQGLPFRGDKEEYDSNVIQLLRMKAESDSILSEWLKRKENVYTSPVIQNEMIKMMALSILRSIISTIKQTPFLTIIADETADCSNREQVTLFLRFVTEQLDVHEEFLGLYHVDSINAATIHHRYHSRFISSLCINRLRGQCYDGASAMAGSKSGVAKRILDIEPRAYFTHCYGHALNLTACDTLKRSKIMKDSGNDR